MSNWSNPTLTSLYTDVLADLKSRDVDAATMAEAPTTPPVGYIRLNRTTDLLEEWDGSAWQVQVLSVAGGGTGSSSPGGARTALGLGTMATQNSNAVSISGGSISGLSSLGVSGNATIGGLIIAGSGPVTLTDTTGNIQELAIADGPYLSRNAANEVITGWWTFNNTIAANINGNAAFVTDGMYLSANQTSSGRKLFTASQTSGIGNPAANLGGIELYGAGGTAAAFMSFHRPGIYAAYFGLDSDNQFKIGGYSLGTNAFPILHSNNFNTYAPTLTGGGASGTWAINVTGNSGSTNALTTAITINGTPVNVGSNVTITCAAGTLTGATLNSSVTASSLTSLGTITNLTVGNGAAATPAVRFSGSMNSGLYFNPGGQTVECGARFDNSDRAVMRAFANQVKIDFLLGTTIPLELGDSQVLVGPTSPANLQVRGDISPLADNTYQIGFATTGRWQEVWAVNGTIQTSDIRHKKVHEWLNGREALDVVLKFETFVASWLKGNESDKFLGLSAQNIERVVDERYQTKTVRTDNPDCLGLNAAQLIPLLAAAIQGLNDRIDNL